MERIDFQDIEFEVADEHVATVTLNRPKAYNAFTEKMAEEMLHVCKTVRETDDIHSVVLGAAGEKPFYAPPMTPAADVDRSLLPERLVRWIEEITGEKIVRIVPRAGGGAVREGAEIDLRSPDGSVRPCFLAYARNLTSTRGLGTDAHYRREGSLLRALQDRELRVPPLVAYSVEQRALLFGFVEGETLFSAIEDPAEREQVAFDFVRELAKLHAIDPASLELDGFGPLQSASQSVRERLDALEREHTEGGAPDPLIVFVLDWLRRTVPRDDDPAAIVHGDAGPANFLHRDGRMTALLDWELAHFGDPLEDFAWISIRSLFQPFVALPGLFAEYELASGRPVDIARVRFYRLYCLLGLIVGSHRTWVQQPEKIVELGGAVGTAMGYSMLHKRVLIEELALAMGVALPEFAPPEPKASASAPYFEVALGEIRDLIVPRSRDQVVVHRAKGLARLLKYLQSREERSALYEEDELRDLAEVLGANPPSVEAARLELVERIRAATVDPEVALGAIHRRNLRETAVLASSMGSLARRHFAPLE
jgi:aminoglycoside phosphotransferase